MPLSIERAETAAKQLNELVPNLNAKVVNNEVVGHIETHQFNGDALITLAHIVGDDKLKIKLSGPKMKLHIW